MPHAGRRAALRHYDPKIGRWLNNEPVGYEADATLYRYVSNKPAYPRQSKSTP
ncbi:MAG: RHS repeat-associated core domain-containing protein [Singulisphaera sp.]